MVNTKYNKTHIKKLLYGKAEAGNYKKEGQKEGGEDYRGAIFDNLAKLGN